ncbi:MAG: transcriptional regulator NrdR [Propionibacteriaceae bacterium]|nr:transcriptional repressor NrdR [Micropruina sp.]HBX81304.1 transcriptional regulator NrdR [Propionibacteriaceae bacterium]HBY24095.1 transcriptional regulator NrdR [Propionibacteriaceae bacterium]
MHCPFCRHTDTRVLDSRVAEDGTSIRRRRQCPMCERRFTTLEQMQLVVVKRSGVVEPFSREKVVSGVRKACKGRPVTDVQLARLGQRVEETLRASGQAEIPADDVGLAILAPLRELDPVVYLRFASVYKHYASVEDFESEIKNLRGTEPAPV